MGDLAFHESLVSILRHFGDPRYFPEGLYRRNLGEPNQLFHAAAWALSFACPTDTACKIVVAASVLGVSVGAGRLASHLGATRWSALLVSPLALGWMFRWGLVANLVGFATWLFALPALDRLAKDPSFARAIRATLLAGLLYLGHESSMVIYAIASAVFALQTPRRLRPLALAACPGAFSVVLAVIYAVRSEPLKAASVRAVHDAAMPLGEKIVQMPGALFSLGETSLPFFAVTLLALLALLLAARSPAAEGEGGEGPSISASALRFEILVVGLFGLYFTMPLTWSGSTLIHQRFLAPAFALALLTFSPRARGAPGWAPVLAAFPVTMLALTLGGFVEADRSYRDLDAVLLRMEDRSAVAQLDLTPRAPSVVAPVVGAGARALAVHGGRLLFSFTDTPAAPVSVPPEYQWNEPVTRLSNYPYAFSPAHDLLRFRYVLARLTVPDLVPAIVQAFAPEASLVTREGPWLLFESTLPLVPLTAKDDALPEPAPETLGQRVQAALLAGSGIR
jgi:hypothetical protein